MSLEMATKNIALELIRIDGGTQPRAEVNQEMVREYAQDMLLGVTFPPVILFYDGSNYWLADGFHRYYAAKQSCHETIPADVKQGTRRDAVLYSVGANASHGLRRTNADKRRAVETLLNDLEWIKWSDSEIARRTSTSHTLVGQLRNLTCNIASEERAYITKHGTEATMNTANIGQQQNLTRQEFVDEVFPNFAQWQKDNLALGLDEFADPLPAEPLDEEEDYKPSCHETIAQPPFVTLARVEVEQERLREIRREEARERIVQLREKGAQLPMGKFSCLVVDPPWPMQKIERDVRPNQVEFDYPTMSEEELRAFPLPEIAADNCHLYLWTTQKYLPMAIRLAEHWGFKYQCLMTWVKNVGFTPFSWMYSTEHVLFCTKGSLPLLRIGARLDFSAKVREHSRKPEEFYELVREVSPGPRIDVFSREKRAGFEQYGNEVEKFV